MSALLPFERALESSLDVERQQFLGSLVHAGLVSEEFAGSGLAERFATAGEVTQNDAMKHVLIGDIDGGVHHLPTMMGLGVENVTVASKIARVHPADGSLYPLRYDKSYKVMAYLGRKMFAYRTVRGTFV